MRPSKQTARKTADDRARRERQRKVRAATAERAWQALASSWGMKELRPVGSFLVRDRLEEGAA